MAASLFYETELKKGEFGNMADKTQNNKAAPVIADPYSMPAKLEINPKADAKNFIEIRGAKPILCCGASKEHKRGPGAKCRSYAGQGTKHPGYGRCKFCGGANTGPKTAEGKAITARNSTTHGLYASVLGKREAEIFNRLQKDDVLSLEYEINMMKAKILGYLEKAQGKWEYHRSRKLAERYVKYKCAECGFVFVRGELEGSPGYCIKGGCGSRDVKSVESWTAERTDEEATAYADIKSKIYYKEGETGGRSYYHATTIEDKALDRALNTLGRLVEKHARLKGLGADDLLDAVNAELRSASQGQVSISWGSGTAQRREGAE